MEGFWNFMEIVVIVNGALLALFVVLIAIPQTGLKKIFLKILGTISYIIVGFLLLYIISPADLLPDVVPILGQADDAVGVLGAIINFIIGYVSFKKSNEKVQKTDAELTVIDLKNKEK